MKKALISGITVQDGSYLAEFFLGKSYEVYGDLNDASSLNRIIKKAEVEVKVERRPDSTYSA